MLNTRKLVVLATGATAIYVLEKGRQLIKTEKSELQKSTKNSENPLIELKSGTLVNYPWVPDFSRNKRPENWEFRKVKVRGSLYKHFHLVYRERKGEPGYIVFKGIKTANSVLPLADLASSVSLPAIGMMVKLGWISAKNVRDLPQQEVNFVSKVEYDTSLSALSPQVVNPITGFVYNSEGEDLEYPIEDMNEEEVEITGFLRKGEKQNWLTGKRRFPTQKTTTFIDLDRMASFYTFANVFAATNYYLEAAVEDPENNLEMENKIIPANLDKPLAEPDAETNFSAKKTLRNAEILTGVITGLGLYLL